MKTWTKKGTTKAQQPKTRLITLGVITFFRTFFPAKTCRGRKKPESFPLSQIVAFSSHERRFD